MKRQNRVKVWLALLIPHCFSGLKRQGLQHCLDWMRGDLQRGGMTLEQARTRLSDILWDARPISKC
ncbi:hypothetical protein B484DRAFT_404914 [Ochromonadaceae sp. CCMP2298]|nr:hypothetical protein B484DRAFT_404914 [Ochromonadaceae sp. CCMP2298]